MAHPLAGDAGRVGPEKAVFEVGARIPFGLRAVAEEAFPVGVLFLDRGDEFRPAPAAGLIDVPRHFRGDDGAELAAFQVFERRVIGGAGAALRADLDDPVGGFHRLERGAGVLHGLGEGFFAIDVAAGRDRLDGVERVLEVRSGDDDGVEFRLFIHFLVVAVGLDVLVEGLFEKRLRLVAADAPDVRNADDFAIEPGRDGLVGGEQRALQAVRKADDADADAVVRAGGAGLAEGGLECLGGEQAEGAERAGAEDFTTIHGWMIWVGEI